MNAAFEEWWDTTHGGTPTHTEEACFLAGIEHARGVSREGSMVRGRTVVALRTLSGSEIRRESRVLSSSFVWPCLELDDGSVVYALKTVEGGGYGPAILAGQVAVGDEVKRVTYSPERNPVSAALVRGLADGQRLIDGKVTAEQLADELEKDPPA